MRFGTELQRPLGGQICNMVTRNITVCFPTHNYKHPVNHQANNKHSFQTKPINTVATRNIPHHYTFQLQTSHSQQPWIQSPWKSEAACWVIQSRSPSVSEYKGHQPRVIPPRTAVNKMAVVTARASSVLSIDTIVLTFLSGKFQ